MPTETLTILQKRSDFLRVQAAPRVGTATLVLHGCRSDAGEVGIRIGFTATKRCGNAVTRNRIKRRLRALAREILPAKGKPGWDYVLIGKLATEDAAFALLVRDMGYALKRLHASNRPGEDG